MDLKLVSSVVFVEDIQRSRNFYVDVLAQKILMDHGPNVGFEGGFAIWQKGAAHQMIFGAMQPSGPHTFELYFESGDLDSVVARLQEKQVCLVHALKEQPWGQRVIRCYDPDGHILEIGEPMSAVIMRLADIGHTPSEIAEKTFMPVEIVEKILGSA